MAGAQAAVATAGACGSTVLCQTGYTCPATPTASTNFGVACLYANANGGANQTVTLSGGTGTPPAAPGTSTTYWITATVTEPFSIGFLSVIGVHDGSASATATGAVIAGSSAGNCLYIMDPSASGAYTIVGTATVSSTCGIYVNSTSSNAFTAKGTSTTTASVINVVGGVDQTGGASVSPSPTTGSAPVTDPLSNLPAPTYSGCDHTNFSASGGTYTFSPRSGASYSVFCGGLSITGQATLTFNPGIYILNGGGFSSTSSNTTITGNGVFFYNTSNGYSFGPISLAGGTSVTLTAPTSGTYQGILFFQDRSIKSSATSTIVGGATGTLSGAVYMPTASVIFKGNSTTAQTLAFVVDTFQAVGTSYFAKDTTGALTGMSQSKSYLVQ